MGADRGAPPNRLRIQSTRRSVPGKHSEQGPGAGHAKLERVIKGRLGGRGSGRATVQRGSMMCPTAKHMVKERILYVLLPRSPGEFVLLVNLLGLCSELHRQKFSLVPVPKTLAACLQVPLKGIS